jgi:hypothetical protein
VRKNVEAVNDTWRRDGLVLEDKLNCLPKNAENADCPPFAICVLC